MPQPQVDIAHVPSFCVSKIPAVAVTGETAPFVAVVQVAQTFEAANAMFETSNIAAALKSTTFHMTNTAAEVGNTVFAHTDVAFACRSGEFADGDAGQAGFEVEPPFGRLLYRSPASARSRRLTPGGTSTTWLCAAGTGSCYQRWNYHRILHELATQQSAFLLLRNTPCSACATRDGALVMNNR